MHAKLLTNISKISLTNTLPRQASFLFPGIVDAPVIPSLFTSTNITPHCV